MVECPVCGVVGPSGQAACAACGLRAEFFEVVRHFGEPETDTRFARAGGEMTGVGQAAPLLPTPPAPDVSSSRPPDILSDDTQPERSEERPVPDEGDPLEDAPGTADEAVRVGRALGLDLTDLVLTMNRARLEKDTTQLAVLRRELIRSVLDGLVDRYRQLCDRRDALASQVRTPALDTALAAYRRALSGEGLARAEEQRETAQHALDSIEDSWSRIRTQFTNARQMIRALREMGGVAPGVLRPVAEAIRIPRRGEAGQIERRLNRANRLLWGLLVPRMNHQISKGLSLLDKTDAPAAIAGPIRSEIDRMAEKIRNDKISEALESRLFLRVALTSLAPRAPKRTGRRSFIE